MKTIYSTFLCIGIAAITLSSCTRRVYVSERPGPPPVVMAPGAPYPGSVWIPEEYAWRGGRYEYIAPHYARAPRGRSWSAGYWDSHRGRSTWVKGHWRR